MDAIRTYRTIPWTALIVLAGTTVVIMAIIFATWVGLLLAVPLVVALVVLPRLVAQEGVPGPDDTPRVGRWRPDLPRVQRMILTQRGTVRTAQVVPLRPLAGYQVVLTSDGYLLVDSEGRAIRRLGRG